MASHPDKQTIGHLKRPDEGQWGISFWRIHSESSKVNQGLMLILEENVTCTGSEEMAETKFKLYNGGEKGIDVMFECIGGSSHGMMLCVDSNHRLTARKRTKVYNNFEDAEEDVLFYYDIPEGSNQYQFRWRKDDTCIAFTKDGQPIPLNDPNVSQEETLFRGFYTPMDS